MIRMVSRLWSLAVLCAYFHYELVVSSLRVAWDVITPRSRARPGIVAVPIDLRSDTAVLALANLVSLTPGSLSLDVSGDRRTLYVHAMFIDNVEEVRSEIKGKIELRIREAFE